MASIFSLEKDVYVMMAGWLAGYKAGSRYKTRITGTAELIEGYFSNYHGY